MKTPSHAKIFYLSNKSQGRNFRNYFLFSENYYASTNKSDSYDIFSEMTGIGCKWLWQNSRFFSTWQGANYACLGDKNKEEDQISEKWGKIGMKTFLSPCVGDFSAHLSEQQKLYLSW